MKKKLWKSLGREIRQTMTRFLAILAITALGVGVYVGLTLTGPSMKATAQQYYTQQNLMDMRIRSTMGFTKEDIETLRQRPEVNGIMPSYSLDVLVELDDGISVATMFTLPPSMANDNNDYLSQVVLKDGRMPQTLNECVMDSAYADSVKIGDVIHVPKTTNEKLTMDLLAVNSFTVVGLVESPMYISLQRGNSTIGDGKVNFFFYVQEDSFDSEFYTDVFLTLDNEQDAKFYSETYKELMLKGEKDLGFFAEKRTQARYDSIYGEAKLELDKARKKAQTALDEALKKLEDARAEIDRSARLIAQNERELQDAKVKVDEGERALVDAKRELAAQWAKYNEGYAAYQAGRAKYDAAVNSHSQGVAASAQIGAVVTNIGLALATDAEINAAIGGLQAAANAMDAAGAGVPATTVRDAATAAAAEMANTPPNKTLVATQMAIGNGAYKGYLDAVKTQLDSQIPVLTQTEQQLASAKAQLDSANATLVQKENEWLDAKAKVEDGLKQIASAKVKIANARSLWQEGMDEYNVEKEKVNKKLVDAQKELDKLEPPEWYFYTREDNPGYSGFVGNADRVAGIATLFPVFFFAVAALVSLTTMTRMVEEQRTQIGTLKALGYGKYSIAMRYVMYSGLASILGAVGGAILGGRVFPTTIWNTYRTMYTMPSVTLDKNPAVIFGCIGVAVLCTTAASLSACFAELTAVPSMLMRPKAPKEGKRVLLEKITFIWKRLSFSQKVTMRNLFRYKKRVFMTILGVAGCAALLVAGFGVYDSISGLAYDHFERLQHSDMAVILLDNSSSDVNTSVNRQLQNYGQSMYEMEEQASFLSVDGKTKISAYLQVGERPGNMKNFLSFYNYYGKGEAVDWPQQESDAVLLTSQMAMKLGVKAGDTITIQREGHANVELKVGAVVENYINNYCYMTPAAYESLYKEAPQYNTIWLKLSENQQKTREEISEELMKIDNVATVVDYQQVEDSISDATKSLNMIVLLIVVAAAALGIVVLYNLTNINITERVREIATLKVLGFYDNEVARYIFRENIILTFLSIGFGLVGGIFLHKEIMVVATQEEMMFRAHISPWSFLLAAGFTLLVSALVNLIMMRRLRNISMVESLKSAE